MSAENNSSCLSYNHSLTETNTRACARDRYNKYYHYTNTPACARDRYNKYSYRNEKLCVRVSACVNQSTALQLEIHCTCRQSYGNLHKFILICWFRIWQHRFSTTSQVCARNFESKKCFFFHFHIFMVSISFITSDARKLCFISE
jgi:hypothetical protein